MITSVLT